MTYVDIDFDEYGCKYYKGLAVRGESLFMLIFCP
jgi:hypothetical protein